MNTAVVVPGRAPLPPGASNYVTPRGLELLRAESRELARERVEAETGLDGADRTHALVVLNRRKADLDERLASAVLVSAPEEPGDEVRFGAAVRVRGEDGRERSYQIVGVDEASPGEGRIAFVVAAGARPARPPRRRRRHACERRAATRSWSFSRSATRRRTAADSRPRRRPRRPPPRR